MNIPRHCPIPPTSKLEKNRAADNFPDTGHDVTLITSQGRPCAWGKKTGEQTASNGALIHAGVAIVTNQMLSGVSAGYAELSCVFTGNTSKFACDAVVPVTRRVPVLGLYDDLQALDLGSVTITRIGDADDASTIAAAVYSGYRAAMDLGEDVDLATRYGRREYPILTG